MKNFLFFLCAISVYPAIHSQNYYAGEYAHGTNVTYRCKDMFFNTRVISNKKNTRVMTAQKLKDGTDAPPDPYRNARSNDPDNEKLHEIIRETFTPGERKKFRLKKASLTFDLIIDPDGTISEVGFLIRRNSPLTAVKPDTFFQIEQKVKQRIRYTLDDKSQRLYLWVGDLTTVDFKDL